MKVGDTTRWEATNTTRANEQLGNMTRLTVQSGDKTRGTAQNGDPTDTSSSPPTHLLCQCKKEDTKEAHTVLKCMTEHSADLSVLEENMETAILDTGCARSTSGRQWIEAHIRNLSKIDRSEVRRKK